jgi:hypothetical protein
MFRNTHTLLLFNHNEALNQQCAVLFYKLSRGYRPEARQIGNRLSLSLAKIWDEEWINPRYSAKPGWIRLDFQTAAERHFPIHFLQQIFATGINGAALETFHDQVCEVSRCYFLQGYLVEADAFYQALPIALATCQAQLIQDKTIYIEKPDRPVPLAQLCESGDSTTPTQTGEALLLSMSFQWQKTSRLLPTS